MAKKKTFIARDSVPRKKTRAGKMGSLAVTSLFRIIRIQRHSCQFNERLIYFIYFFSVVLVKENEY